MGRAVVAGGAGFIGSHLCDRLVEHGVDVLCVDNLVTGSVDNVGHLIGHRRFTFVEADITETGGIEELGTGRPGSIDWILHLASPASPADYARLPLETLRAGTLGTMRCLELARATGAVLLLASTSEVYGDPLVHPQPESYRGNVDCTGPRSVYDEAKRVSETMARAYLAVHGVSPRIARIFNTYGPRMRPTDGRAVPTFVRQALAGEPLTVFGDGTQTRSLCHVDDLVAGLLALLASGVTVPVNLGNPEEVTVGELAALVVEVTGSSSPIVHRPLPDDDPRRRCPDIELARSRLGWAPRIGLRDGLERTVRAGAVSGAPSATA